MGFFIVFGERGGCLINIVWFGLEKGQLLWQEVRGWFEKGLPPCCGLIPLALGSGLGRRGFPCLSGGLY